MPRRARPSSHPIARLRAWFGLGHAELGLYLGLSESFLSRVESGQKAASLHLTAALLPLLQQVPPPGAPAPPDLAAANLPPGTPAPDAAELDFRRRVCLARISKLEAELGKLLARAQAAHHWAVALPALLPPKAAPATALLDLTPAEAAQREAWRQDWLRRRARPLPPAEATRAALLRAKLAGLRAEAAALAEKAAP